MSAVVCGKRSFFDEIHGSPPIPKRIRCGGGSSPVRLASWRSGSPPAPAPAAGLAEQIAQLRELFPEMDEELVHKVFESSGNSLDLAIKSLTELRLCSDGGSDNHLSVEGASSEALVGLPAQDGTTTVDEKSNDQVAASSPEGSEWVELFVKEMLSASNLDDARDRAAKALEAFEKAVMARMGSHFEDLQKENAVLKEQLQGFLRDNHVLKRAVAIQHERQVEHENCSREMQQLKQLIAQYQEQVRTLELNNYALSLHLRKAQEASSIPGHFHPDVF